MTVGPGVRGDPDRLPQRLGQFRLLQGEHRSQKNLAITKFTESSTVRRMDAFSLLQQPPDREYHFIYVAPPQYQGLWTKALHAIDDNPSWLVANTVVILQIDPSEEEAITLNHLERYDERRYGNTLLWFFETNASIPDSEE